MSECDGGLPPASPTAVPTRAREQHRVVHRHAEDGGHGAPTRDGKRQDVAPARPVGPCRDRDAHERVEEGERDAGQHAHLEVAGGELLLDRLERRRQDLRAIHGVEHVAQRQRAEHVVRVPRLGQERRLGGNRRLCGLQLVPPVFADDKTTGIGEPMQRPWRLTGFADPPSSYSPLSERSVRLRDARNAGCAQARRRPAETLLPVCACYPGHRFNGGSSALRSGGRC